MVYKKTFTFKNGRTTDSFFYLKEHGSFYFYIDNVMKFMCDSVAIAFDSKTYTFHKHGAPDTVNKWVKNTRNKFVTVMPKYAEDIQVIESKHWDLDDLNSILAGCSVKLIIDKMDLKYD